VKDFDSWNEKKKTVEDKDKVIGIKERDVLFVHMGLNVGYEQNGKGDDFLRPVVVLSVFNRGLFLGLPLTSKDKSGDFFAPIEYIRNGSVVQSTAILIQTKSFDTKRVKYKAGYVSKNTFDNIKERVLMRLTLTRREPMRELIHKVYNNFEDKSSFWQYHNSSIIDDGVSIGKNTKIWHFSHILSGCVIGENCSFGQNCVVGPKVSLGNGVKVQNNVSVYEGVECEDDVFLGPSMVFTNVINPRAFIVRKEEFKKTLLKKGCSVGANATIVCGVTIGEYALIGSGAVVNREVKPFALMVGVPARQIGWVSKAGNTLSFDEKGEAIDGFDDTRYRLENEELKMIEG